MLGVVMLDTRFPRLLGDIGNPASFSVPVRYRVVRGARAEQAVRGDPDSMLEPFIDAAEALVADGARTIATSCGFLSPFQEALEWALPVPVVTSSLLQVRSVAASLAPDARPGILTVDAAALGRAHLDAARVPAEIAVAGLRPTDSLVRTIMEDRDTLDRRAAEAETVDAAVRLSAMEPRLGAVILECTNLGPYVPALRRALGVPVLSIVDAVEAVMEGAMA